MKIFFLIIFVGIIKEMFGIISFNFIKNKITNIKNPLKKIFNQNNFNKFLFDVNKFIGFNGNLTTLEERIIVEKMIFLIN